MSSKITDYLIIGNSVSGIAAVESIRECDRDGIITVISEENYLNYSRPLISYLLGNKISMKATVYRNKDFYADKKVELMLNTKAVELNLDKKEITLSGGKKISFNKLLIATGGIPILPKIEGLDLDGVFSFTKMDDVDKIRAYIKENKVKDVCVIGGGLIGLKATEAFMNLNIKVTIIELADRILSATFDKKASQIVEKALNKKGCKLMLNRTAKKISGKKNKVGEVVLDNGEKIPADLVVCAIGVRPNLDLVKDSMMELNKGIVVDKYMQTNVEDIYAAGDCCSALDLLINAARHIAILPVAARQGKIAGFNMAGVKKEYQGGFAMNAVELCDIPTISLGMANPEDKDCEVLEYVDKDKAIYKKIVIKDGKIIGAIFIGDIERAGIYTGFIKDKIDVTGFKEYLFKEDFGLICLPKEYRTHFVTGAGIEI